MRAMAAMGEPSWDRSTRLQGYFPIDQPLDPAPAANPAGDMECASPTEAERDLAESDRWATAIGRLVIAFARVEHAVTVLIRQCTADALGHKMARLDLSTRLVYFDKLLRDSGLSRLEKVGWRRTLKRIRGLAARCRTILAYGVPLPGPIEFTGSAIIVRISQSGQRSSESSLTLAQIEMASEDVTAARLEFVRTATDILSRLFAEGRLPAADHEAAPKTTPRAAGANRRDTEALLSANGTTAPRLRPRGSQLVGNEGT